MTQLQRDGHRMLVLHFGGARYALSAAELAAIDQDGDGARIAVDGPVQDLATLLPRATPRGKPVRLVIGSGSGRRAFRASAELELIETSALYSLPRFLRAAGCAPWIRGVALLGHEEPTLWIDLRSIQ